MRCLCLLVKVHLGVTSSLFVAVSPGGAEPRRELSSGCLSVLGNECLSWRAPPAAGPVRRRPQPGLRPQEERGTQSPGQSVAV